MATHCVSFLTDYGTADGFVAACHGVLATIAPDARVIDVSHEVPPQDVRTGAALLSQVVSYFPPSSIHLAVVDPGVGTQRRPVVLVTVGGLLVGPDNGLLGWAADALGGVDAAYELREERYRLPHVSRTFHGRDIFAPAAAHIAAGVKPAALGPEVAVENLVRIPQPLARLAGTAVEAEAVVVDRFGNVQLAASPALLAAAGLHPGTRLRLAAARRTTVATYGGTFGDVAPGAALVYEDSAGLVAVAVNRGSAAALLDLSPGDRLRLSGAGE